MYIILLKTFNLIYQHKYLYYKQKLYWDELLITGVYWAGI